MKRKLVFITGLLLILALVFVSCAREEDPPPVEEDVVEDAADPTPTPEPAATPPPPEPAPAGSPLAALDELAELFPIYINTGLPHVPGTTLYLGEVAASPWAGIIGGAIFHDAATDASIATPLGTGRSIFSMNEFMQFGQEGIATWEIDLNAMTFTINQVMDVFWHDGVPLTLDDLVFAYEVMAHPDYTGPRFVSEVQAVSGIMDFRADLEESGNPYVSGYIPGLVLSNNNRTLVMHFDNMGPGMLYFGLWTAPTPRHLFESIPVAEMAASDWARTTPVGWGPFMIEHVVAGESVSMVRNPDYVFGMPQLERIEIRRVPPELVAESMHAGVFDIISFPTAEYGDHMDPTSFRYLGTPVGDYSYIAFRLGHWDFDNDVNVFTPSRKMSEAGPLFRQAMAYSIDPDFIGQVVFHGLQVGAGSNVTPNHRALINPDLRGFPYDPDRARQLLDEAGFDQFDDEGFRLDRNGERFTVYWAFMEAPLTEHIIVPFYIEQWAAVGIRVELWRGSTHPALMLWDYLDFDADDDEIDIYSGAWSVGANPNPQGTWGHIWWNPSRYTSPEYDAILDRMNTMAAFDSAYLQQVFFDWQDYWQYQVPYFPLLWGIALTSINNRVTFWDTRFWNSGTNPRNSWLHIGLSAPQPYGR